VSYAVTDDPQQGRYEITVGGESIGFVTYRMAPGIVTFLHAEIEPAHEREGWGSRLVAGALDDARARGLKVQPVCPFVASYIELHPEYGALLA
jgi:predicted GNAT family acetyltransferase